MIVVMHLQLPRFVQGRIATGIADLSKSARRPRKREQLRTAVASSSVIPRNLVNSANP